MKVTTIDRSERYKFVFTAPEDGIYTFDCQRRDEEGDWIKSSGIKYYNASGNLLDETSALKADEKVYLVFDNADGDYSGNELRITPEKKAYQLKSIQVETEPSDKTYVEKLEFNWDSNIKPKTDGLKIKAVYSDGAEEILEAGDQSREEKVVETSVAVQQKYDEEKGEYVKTATLNVNLGQKSVSIPVQYQTISEYIQTLKGGEISDLETDQDKDVQFNGSKGVLCRFVPSESGMYILKSVSNRDTYGYLFDENGTMLAEDDDSGRDGNFKISSQLEAGKTYYYLARPYSSWTGNVTLQLTRKEEIKSAKIENPEQTTFISKMNEPSDSAYQGLRVTLTFVSGKEVTYTYGEEGFDDYISLSDDYKWDENGAMIPGDYKLTLKADDKELGSIPIKVQTLAQYAAEHSFTALHVGQDVTEKYEKNEQKFYSFTPEKSGEYRFKSKGQLDTDEGVNGAIRVYDENANTLWNSYDSESRISLESGKTYYVRVISDDSCSATYNTSVQECRTLQQIVLEETEMSVGIGISQNLNSTLYNKLDNLKTTLKFTDGTQETLRWGMTTEDGYSLDWDYPSLKNKQPGDYKATVSCGKLKAEFTIHLYSAKDFLSKSATELTSDKRTALTLIRDEMKAYTLTAPEEGYYKLECLGKEQPVISYYDADGNQMTQPLKLTQGQKIYVLLENSNSESAKYLIRMEKQEKALTGLTVKSQPNRIRMIENIDYISGRMPDVKDYTEGLVVTAAYSDGTTQDLECGDQDVLGNTVEADFRATDGKYDLTVTLGEMQAEGIGMQSIRFSDYLKESGKDLAALKANTDQRTYASDNKYQIYRFEAEKDDTYTFYSKGDACDTYGVIFGASGEDLIEDDDSGSGMNFKMQYKLKKGNVYYLAVRSYDADNTTIRISDSADKTGEEGALSDFQVVSQPKQTVFCTELDGGYLGVSSLSYEGLKISAKKADGTTVYYTYDREDENCPFDLRLNVIYRDDDDDDKPLAGTYPVEVRYQDKKVAEFSVTLKDLKDYLAMVDTELKPGDTVQSNWYNPIIYEGNYYLVKLPQNLKGSYGYYKDVEDYEVKGIYDADGQKTSFTLNGDQDWNTSGKDYYLCLRKRASSVPEKNKFHYEKMSEHQQISDLEIVTQPDVQRYSAGMNCDLLLRGMAVKLNYEDGSAKTVSVERYSDLYGRKMSVKDAQGNTISRADQLQIGENKLYLVFAGKQQEFTIYVNKPTEEAKDTLVPGQESTYYETDAKPYHVYTYTPQKDGAYRLDVEQKDFVEETDQPSRFWICTDENGKYIDSGSSGYEFSLKAGKTYYFATYNENSAFVQVSAKLTEISQNQETHGDVYKIDVTAPDKTVYRPEEKISYDGMKIRVLYEDGTEKEYIAEEAQKAGFEISDDVRKSYRYNRNFPGSYKITVYYENADFSVKNTTPVTVEMPGTEQIKLLNQESEILSDKKETCYSFEVSQNGYYQLKTDAEKGTGIEAYVDGEEIADFNAEKKNTTDYSELTYLKKGKHSLYIFGENDAKQEGFSCKMQMNFYASLPQSIELLKAPEKIAFTYGENISFAGAQFKVNYKNGDTKTITVPEGYETGKIMETGLWVSEASYKAGELTGAAGIEFDYDTICKTDVPYSISWGNIENLENQKTYTLQKEQLKKQGAVYQVNGKSDGDSICTIAAKNAYLRVLLEDGSDVEYSYRSFENERTYNFLAEKNKKYYVVVETDDEESSQNPEITLNQTKAIKQITALPEDVIYALGENPLSMEDLKVQLTYTDGTTGILQGRNQGAYLFDLQLPDITAAGMYHGKLFLGNLQTSYSRKVEEVADSVLKAEETVSLKGNTGYQRFKFTPEKTQYYYALAQNGGVGFNYYVDAANGDSIVDMRLEEKDLSHKLFLTAGKTYYFNVSAYAAGTFVITDGQSATAQLKENKKSYEYTGAEIKPDLMVTYMGKVLKEGSDYQLTFKNNVNAGEAAVEITPTEASGLNFEKRTVTFTIEKCSLNDHHTVIAPISDQAYTGKAVTPDVNVTLDGKTLVKDQDYTVSYQNNINPGKAQVEVTGIGNYAGTINGTFQIKGKQVQQITLDRTSASVTAGNSLKLAATVTPKDANNTTLTWKSDNPGIATVDQTGKVTVKAGAKGGSVVKITASAADQSGKSAVCTIKVNNKITYKLNGGTQNKKNKTTFCKQNVKLYNPSRSGYSFGGWYTDKKLKTKITSITKKTVKNVTLYAKWTKVSKCKAPTGIKLKNAKKKTVTVSFKAVSGAAGYEIGYAQNRKFSKEKKVSVKAASAKIAGLKKTKTYYVRIRAYKVDSTGSKIYGAYSKIAKIKIAK